MSDEAHFRLSGFVNKQNFTRRSDTNHRLFREKRLHSQKVTVLYAILANGIIDPFLFRKQAVNVVTANSDRYVT